MSGGLISFEFDKGNGLNNS